MSEFAPITTLEDLEQQPDEELIAGYRSGYRNEPEPGSDRSRAFWHGWRNGRVDGGHAPIDAAQEALCRAIAARNRAN
jgi:hypothetical protein